VIETTTSFNLGASGGALFDEDGRLLGLTGRALVASRSGGLMRTRAMRTPGTFWGVPTPS